jgi:outer membrane protein TolC
MTRFIVPLFILLLTATIASAQDPEPEDLQFLVLEALTNNPAIAAELDKMEAGAARVPQAGALDDPVLSFKWMEFPSASLGKSRYQNIELMQMVRFPTKLSTQSAIAEIRADHAHHEHLEKVLEVISQLKSSVGMLWYARTAYSINKENQRLLAQIVAAAQRNYSVGRVKQTDVLRANIEFARAKAEESSILQEVMTSESMVRSLLNRRPTSVIGPILIDSVLVPLPKSEALIQFAIQNHPMLVHDSLAVTESELMVSLAKQEYLPDLRFSVEYVRMPMVPQQLWTVSAGLSLPFAPWTLSKAGSRVEEAKAETGMRTHLFQNSKNMIDAQVRSAYAKVQASETMVVAYEWEILPQTLQSLQSLLTDYQTGQSSYLVLIDSYRMYEMTRMDAAKARMEYIKNLALLERETGVIELSVVPQEESQP